MGRAVEVDPSRLLAGLSAPVGSDEVGERILDAAAELFEQRGIRRCSIDDIADHSGVGRTTVYRHFDGRSGVIDAVLVRECRRFFASIMVASAGAERFEDAIVEGLLTGLDSPEARLLSSLVRNEHEVLELFTVGSAPLVDAARDFLVDAFGEVASAQDRDLVAAVAELLVRFAVSLVLDPTSVIAIGEPDVARVQLHRLLDPMLVPLGERRR